MKPASPVEVEALAGLARGVKQARETARLTQVELARKAGITRRHLINLENGQNISVLILFRVLRVLRRGLSLRPVETTKPPV
jgi:transcriptional regulator with XRE-family HTH domain